MIQITDSIDRDLKPYLLSFGPLPFVLTMGLSDNVFLASAAQADDSIYPDYYQPKIGDFG